MAQGKSAEAFRTISEAAAEIGVPQHVLRHWEEVFGQIRPMRRAGGRRYYRPLDLDILRGVRVLLYDRRYTTKGVQKIFKDHGAKYVAEIGRQSAAGEPLDLKPLSEENADTIDLIVAEIDEPLVLTNPILDPRAAPSLPPELRERLANLLARLERVQEALDEASLALEAAEAGADPAQRRRNG
ncbi:MAG: MerR family transcriptional regulator [Parvularculaceae bacterium]|nr:MerR family transcriptional regulator [Parvularculaceae bacterium]